MQYHGFNFYHMCCDQSPVFHALVYVCYAFFLMIQALFKVKTFNMNNNWTH